MGTEWGSGPDLDRDSDLDPHRAPLTQEEEERRFERFRKDLETWERWNMLPEWKRIWWGDRTREDLQRLEMLIDLADDIDKLTALVELAGKIPELKKSIKLAEGAETAGRFWKNGLMAFFGGILVLGPGLKMLIEMWEWFAGLFRKIGAP